MMRARMRDKLFDVMMALLLRLRLLLFLLLLLLLLLLLFLFLLLLFVFLGVGVTQGKLIVTGGHDGSSTLSSVEQYDPDTNQWTALAPMSTKRYKHAAGNVPYKRREQTPRAQRESLRETGRYTL